MLASDGYLKYWLLDGKYYRARFRQGWLYRYSGKRFSSATKAESYGLAVEERYNKLRAASKARSSDE